MRNLFLIFFSSIFFFYNCASQKIQSPPKYKLLKGEKSPTIKKGHLILNLNDLLQNKQTLYCFKQKNDSCSIIEGEITIFSHYQTTGNDNPTDVTYTYAKGEFLGGKYNGIWEYYDRKGKVIKKEKWDNGKLIHKKEYK